MVNKESNNLFFIYILLNFDISGLNMILILKYSDII